MKLIIAGKEKEFEDGINLTRLIELENVETPQYVTASVNDELLGAADFDSTILKDGDTLEFLYFMGGGC